MGMIGGYNADYYCDFCNASTSVTSENTATGANKVVRERGWKLKRNGEVACPDHGTGNHSLNKQRSGNEWQVHSKIK